MPAASARPHTFRRGTIPFTAAAAASLVVLAGCGSSPKPSAGQTPPKDFVSAAFKYSHCMREHGAANFPDPVVENHGGETGVRMVVPSSLGSTPAFKSALHACQGILPQPGSEGPGLTAQQRHERVVHMLAFAQCMRSHRVSSFPDPTPQGQLSLAMVTAAGIDLHAPAVQAAAYACVPASGGALTAAKIHQALAGGQ
ncbi:MAG TPA: hypothetical protein VGH24_13300 [Solirubrobacteraceae bacterium]